MYEKIARHIGHEIEVATYGNYSGDVPSKSKCLSYGWGDIVNVAVECMNCHEVIVDADNEEFKIQ